MTHGPNPDDDILLFKPLVFIHADDARDAEAVDAPEMAWDVPARHILMLLLLLLPVCPAGEWNGDVLRSVSLQAQLPFQSPRHSQQCFRSTSHDPEHFEGPSIRHCHAGELVGEIVNAGESGGGDGHVAKHVFGHGAVAECVGDAVTSCGGGGVHAYVDGEDDGLGFIRAPPAVQTNDGLGR